MTSVAHPAQSDIGDISDFVTSTKVTITDVVLALVVLIAAWIIARLARRGVRTVLGRVNGISEDLRQLAARVTFYFLLLIGVGVALTFVGAEIQPVLTAGILIAVVAVLALRGIAENFAAGGSSCRPAGRSRSATTSTCSNTPASCARSTAGPSSSRRGTAGGSTSPTARVLNNPLVNHTARDIAALGGRGPLGGQRVVRRSRRRRGRDASPTSLECSPIHHPKSSSAASIRDGW